MSAAKPISRRDFLKLSALSAGSLTFLSAGRDRRVPAGEGRSFARRAALLKPATQDNFPTTPRLGRVTVGKVDLKARPDADSATVGALYEDAVVPWLREVVGTNLYRYDQRYVETPDGFIWAQDLQPVRNEPAQPARELYDTSLGPGMWVEVSVPYVDLILDNPPARAPWLKGTLEYGLTPRLYYSQILWVDTIEFDDDDRVWYRVNERFGFGDIFWARAEGFRPITPDQMAPISPEVEDKHVLIDVTRQTMACFEEGREVYFCRVSTGAKFDATGNRVDHWSTPPGEHRTWRKMVSTHMVGGTTGGGYDLPGIGWTSLFVGTGIAIHSTYWHNGYGTPLSHGCVNSKPRDAQWVFRWILPQVPYDPGDVTVQMPGGTRIRVIES